MHGAELACYITDKGVQSLKRLARLHTSRHFFPILYRLKDVYYPDFERTMWFDVFKGNIHFLSEYGSPTLERFSHILENMCENKALWSIGLSTQRWGKNTTAALLTEVLEHRWEKRTPMPTRIGHSAMVRLDRKIYMNPEAEEKLGELIEIMHDFNGDRFDEMGRLKIKMPPMVSCIH
jgi:hypothetical protein